MTTFHIDKDGKLLRATSDPKARVPGAVLKTEIAPQSGKQTWLGDRWSDPPPAVRREAPPEPAGATVAQLRDEVAAVRQALIDVGVFRSQQ